DGHLIESIPEMAGFMEPYLRRSALNPSRNRQGVFPSLDGFHYPHRPSEDDEKHAWAGASERRPGCGEDVAAFLEKTGIEHTVLFPSEGLAVGNIQLVEY